MGGRAPLHAGRRRHRSRPRPPPSSTSAARPPTTALRSSDHGQRGRGARTVGRASVIRSTATLRESGTAGVQAGPRSGTSRCGRGGGWSRRPGAPARARRRRRRASPRATSRRSSSQPSGPARGAVGVEAGEVAVRGRRARSRRPATGSRRRRRWSRRPTRRPEGLVAAAFTGAGPPTGAATTSRSSSAGSATALEQDVARAGVRDATTGVPATVGHRLGGVAPGATRPVVLRADVHRRRRSRPASVDRSAPDQRGLPGDQVIGVHRGLPRPPTEADRADRRPTRGRRRGSPLGTGAASGRAAGPGERAGEPVTVGEGRVRAASRAAAALPSRSSRGGRAGQGVGAVGGAHDDREVQRGHEGDRAARRPPGRSRPGRWTRTRRGRCIVSHSGTDQTYAGTPARASGPPDATGGAGAPGSQVTSPATTATAAATAASAATRSRRRARWARATCRPGRRRPGPWRRSARAPRAAAGCSCRVPDELGQLGGQRAQPAERLAGDRLDGAGPDPERGGRLHLGEVLEEAAARARSAAGWSAGPAPARG